jgi:Spy/CpxP family protein refolding chaperone
MIKQLNACLEQRCEQFDHDESACFEQFVDEVVRVRNLIESESFDDRKNFRFRNAQRALDRIRIEESRNVDQIDR